MSVRVEEKVPAAFRIPVFNSKGFDAAPKFASEETSIVPVFTVSVPVKLLVPDKVNLEAPFFTKFPDPVIFPE